MNLLCRWTKYTNIGYDLREIAIHLCLNLKKKNPNFHIIKDKMNKNKSGHFQRTQGTYLRTVRTTSAKWSRLMKRPHELIVSNDFANIKDRKE